MNDLDLFFQPISNDHVFEHTLAQADMELRKQLFQEKEKIFAEECKEEPLQDEEMKEFNEIEEATEKAKSKFETELKKYNGLKDELSEMEALQKLVVSTFEDIDRKVVFAMDAFNRRVGNDGIGTTLDTLAKQHILPNAKDACDLMAKEIQASISRLTKSINISKQKIRRLCGFYNFSKQASLGHHCPICYSHEVDTFCEPCGHTYCHRCIKTNYCYICRHKINRTHKLFFT